MPSCDKSGNRRFEGVEGMVVTFKAGDIEQGNRTAVQEVACFVLLRE